MTCICVLGVADADPSDVGGRHLLRAKRNQQTRGECPCMPAYVQPDLVRGEV